MSTPLSIHSLTVERPSGFIESLGLQVQSLSLHLTRYSLVLVLIWIGGMKFTAYEAAGIRPFVENSPLMSFVYQVFTERAFSSLLGAVEIVIGLAIASRPFFPKASALGSLLATGMFLTTLSFLLTTPGAFEASEGGFPALSVPGQFLLKDTVLFAVSLLTFGEALAAAFPRTKS